MDSSNCGWNIKYKDIQNKDCQKGDICQEQKIYQTQNGVSRLPEDTWTKTGSSDCQKGHNNNQGHSVHQQAQKDHKETTEINRFHEHYSDKGHTEKIHIINQFVGLINQFIELVKIKRHIIYVEAINQFTKLINQVYSLY